MRWRCAATNTATWNAQQETPDAILSVGPGPMGGFVRCEFVPARTPIGPSTAPCAVAALAFRPEHCGAELPSLHAASAVG